MTAKLTPQTRLIAIVGLVLLAAVAALMVMRGGLIGSSSDEDVIASDSPVTRDAPVTPTTPAKPSTTPAKPTAVTILPGVPSPVASALQRSKVVVAALVAGGTADRVRVAEARAGARSVGASFVTLDVRKEAQAKTVSEYVGNGTTATVIVVNRPGKIANSFQAYADRAIVAQAALNAGAPGVAPKAKAKAKAGAAPKASLAPKARTKAKKRS
jgi:hypothetical protein